ncbi:unnamed protein product [Polarella glacialis]|uniref:D-serine dehydratase-like domain-containing protein n=1 Tax=Polarella glacialis TaxID=89957 RepID=A0A813EAX1_POLGL|nr:unnamed protein product [Polarella glacialis]
MRCSAALLQRLPAGMARPGLPGPPARAGFPVAATDTPALLLDLAALERNCARIKAALGPFPHVALRPHAKAHKSSAVAAMTLELTGARGVCCQKLCEAEAMVDGGINDILLSNEIISQSKIERLCQLAARPGVKLAVLVDDAGNVSDLAREAARANIQLEVLVEVDVGQNRCGVAPGPATAALASAIVSHSPALRFGGLQCYHGLTQHIRSVAERRAAILGPVLAATKASIAACEAAGVWSPDLRVTGGGTGTFIFEAETGVFNEVQAGSFVLMDTDYTDNDAEDKVKFEPVLHCLATVMSRPLPERAVLDAGTKALDLGCGPPRFVGTKPGTATYRSGGDEHGIIDLSGAAVESDMFKVGSVVWVQPSHCDPTVNLHDWFVLHRDGIVQDCVPIEARGPGR